MKRMQHDLRGTVESVMAVVQELEHGAGGVGDRLDLDECILGVEETKVALEDLTEAMKEQAKEARDTEELVAKLIQKAVNVVNAKTARVEKRVKALKSKSGWVRVGSSSWSDAESDDTRSVLSRDSTNSNAGPTNSGAGAADLQVVISKLKTLEAKVEIQMERSKNHGVIFHKVAFSSEMEFVQWYLKSNVSGKGLAGFVDIVSIWSFASLSTETAAEWLLSLSRQRSVGLDNKVEVEYSHSMSTRYPAAFVGKAELITATQTFKIFEKLVLWRGGGVGDGIKERLLDSLRMAVERQRVYCEDTIPSGSLRNHAIRSAEFTRDFFQATSFGLGEAQVLLLMSNQLMQVCDNLFKFRHAAINVASSNRAEAAARYAWVTLQALGKMSEYLKAKFKHHPSITGTFVHFLTRQTADTSATGMKAKIEALEALVKSLKANSATKVEVEKLHNKLDLIVAANDLKKK